MTNPTNEQARELVQEFQDHQISIDVIDALSVGAKRWLTERIAVALSSRDTGKWQAIETAPKGRDVLLLRANGKYVIGDWAAYEKYNAPTFTHWQSLPDPPLPSENPDPKVRE